jgi:protein-L-isoaspartate(D-aspartate) O-methyltransferase
MNFVEARNNMVLNQLRANRISNASLIEKIELFPRENLFPINFKHLSYSDSIIHLNDGRFVLPPLTSFHLVQALNPSNFDNILEIGSGFGTTTSILNQFTNNIDCIESSEEMINTFNDSMKSGLFSAKLLKNNIELFFTNKNPNIKKYKKILINGSLDDEPFQIINKSDDNAQIVCIIDNKEFKHKIIKYQKVNGNCNRFIIDEASSSLIFKFHKKEQFVF